MRIKTFVKAGIDTPAGGGIMGHNHNHSLARLFKAEPRMKACALAPPQRRLSVSAIRSGDWG